MQLNINCIRDLLLYLENSLPSKRLKIRNIAEELKNTYSSDEILYTF